MNRLAFCHFLGKSEEEIVGRTDFDLFPPPEAEMYHNDDAKVMETGKPQIQDEEVSGGEGKRWLQVAKTPVLDETGVCVGILASVRDITERKEIEETLRQRTAQLEAVREMGLELTAQLDLNALLHSVASRAVELLGGNKGGLYLYRPNRDVLEWTVAVGPNAAPIGTMLHRGEGVSGKILETGQPLIVGDYHHWEGRAAIYEGYPLGSVVGAPIRWGEDLLGVLNVNTNSTHAFSQTDAELLSLLATQAAIAIRNARLYEEAKELHQQTQRDAVIKAELLKEVNHRVANNLTAIIGLLRAEGRYAPSRQHATIETTLNRLIQRINGLAEVHSMLSQSEWSPVRLSDLAARIIQAAMNALPPDQRILVKVSPSPIQVSPRQAGNLALIINELATNTIKHALGDRSTGHIIVHIASENDDAILCRYQDDGVGYPAEVLCLERYDVGVYLIQRIVTMTLRGELTLANDGGAATIIRFPAEERSRT